MTGKRPRMNSLPGNLHVDRVTEEPAETFLHTFAASRFCHALFPSSSAESQLQSHK
jgi:hypothetical protein